MPYGILKADKIAYDASGSDIEANVSDLVNKAGLASPTFTGTPAAPTAAANVNTTQIATTAYVTTAVAAVDISGKANIASPTFTGTVTIPAGASISGFAPIASPTFTGTVTGPTINASTALQIGGTAITSTAAELNILDGVTSTAAELNILDGVTSTATELNLLDGKTVVGDAVLAGGNAWAGAQRSPLSALTDAATIAVDFSNANNFSVTLAGNRELGQPSNQNVGQSGSIFITQDGTGSRTLSYHADWDFAGGTAPTISSTAGAVDRIDYIVAAANKIHAVATLDVK